MATITINTEKEFKKLFNSNRKNISKINDLEVGDTYPLFDISNKHARYYDVDAQEYKFIYPPFIIGLK